MGAKVCSMVVNGAAKVLPVVGAGVLGPALSTLPFIVHLLIFLNSNPLEHNPTLAAIKYRIFGGRPSENQSQSNSLASIQPEVWPSREELRRAHDRLVQPASEKFHCAIAGMAGSGKSSLINAFRGLRNNSPGAARTGVTETTLDITAYPDPSTTPPQNRLVWYDIPGAGTLRIPGWQYFNSQGLFAFDLIIVVTDNRFSEQDIAILKHCERYQIPSFVVRSKANQHIENLMEQNHGWQGADDERDFNEVYQPAKDVLVTQTRQSFNENLQAAELDPGKEVFIVSCNALASLVRGEFERLRGKNQLINEPELVRECLEAVRARRYPS